MTFIHSFEPGGVEKVALRLASAWTEEGVDVSVVLGRGDGALRVQARANIRFLRPVPPPINPAAFETLWMMLVLLRFVRGERPDVLFCPGNTYAVVGVALRLLLGRACPPLLLQLSNDLERRDMAPLARGAYRLWLRVQGRLIDRFVAMSEPLAAEAEALLAVPAHRIFIIPSPVFGEDEFGAFSAARAAARPPESARRYLAAGRLVAQKNFSLLIDAFAAGARERDRLVIVGEGPERGALVRRAKRLGVGDRVDLPGYAADLSPCFADCDLFLLSSDYEGLPAVLVEALAAGVPIVATRCSAAVDDLLDHGRLARIVPVGAAAELADGIALPERVPRDPRAMLRKASQFTVARTAPLYIEAMRRMGSL